MSFTAFSKEFTANMFTAVENQFIVKYLPQANGDAVRVYLYGLYLCNCKEQFDAETVARLLKLSKQALLDIYTFWEECDLVRILSKEPLYVEYLPVNSAVGKPKSVKPEKYAQFNRELMRILQRVGKDFKPYEMQKILEFLENNPMEQQAFLLIAEYCAQKDGEKISCAHILNKAKNLCDEYKFTYDLVESELAGFNTSEKEISKIFTLLGIYRKPQESDYSLLEKWKQDGFPVETIYECAKFLKKGSLSTLDALVEELKAKNVYLKNEAAEYFLQREKLASAVYTVARKLSIKIQNPRAYIDEYAVSWLERGYEEEGLALLAAFAFRMGYGFAETNQLVNDLYKNGIIQKTDIAAYCSEREKQLKLLQSIQKICGVQKKSISTLDMVGVWKSWSFSDEMILEAAKRSASASAPLPYVNKLLSEWKKENVFQPSQIPSSTKPSQSAPAFKTQETIAADFRTDREHYYSVLRQKALERAEKAKTLAQADEEFQQAERQIKKGEIELAKAEVFSPEQAPLIQQNLLLYRQNRANALLRLGISEEDFIPKFACSKCSDTGFLANGRACDCYPNSIK